MFRDMMEVVGALMAIVIGIVLVIWLSVAGHNWYVQKPACEDYGVMSKQKTYFSLGTGCLVERDGEWVNYDVAVGSKQEITLKSK